MTPLLKLSQQAIWKELRQETMCFPFIWSASVREKRLNAAWKIYVAGPLMTNCHKLASRGLPGERPKIIWVTKAKIIDSNNRSAPGAVAEQTAREGNNVRFHLHASYIFWLDATFRKMGSKHVLQELPLCFLHLIHRLLLLTKKESEGVPIF